LLDDVTDYDHCHCYQETLVFAQVFELLLVTVLLVLVLLGY
tara:strand:- start:1943 stop:2065 length:123 start_codon:yes stop_codon:yes gene_type:complete